MIVARTFDQDALTKILNHEKVKKWIVDDLSPEVVTPVIHPAIIYLMDDEQTGTVRIDPINGVTCQIHIATLPEMWGKADEFGELAKAWLWENTRYMKAITMTPAYNKLAARLARKMGFVLEGEITEAFMHNWKLHSLLIFGLNKYQEGKDNG